MKKNRTWKVASLVLAAGMLFPTMASAQTFSDVPKTLWTHDIINEMADKGYIKGYGNGKFGPRDTITRGQAAAMIARSMELAPVRKAKSFSDVPTTNPYYNDIMELYRAGVIDGMSSTNYGVNQKLTRAQMAKVIVNTYDLTTTSTANLSDMKGHWAEKDVQIMYGNGITLGDGTGKYGPSNPLERQHFAVFMHRAMNLDGTAPQEPVTPDEPEEITYDYRNKDELGFYTDQLDYFVYDVTKVVKNGTRTAVYVNAKTEGRQITLQMYKDFGQTMQKLIIDNNAGVDAVNVILTVDGVEAKYFFDADYIYYN